MPAASKKTKIHAVDDEQKTEPPPEADVELVSFQFRGHTFTIPKEMDEWDTEACLAMSQDDFALAAKLLLDKAQWQLLQSLGSKRKDLKAFRPVFVAAVVEHCIN